MSLVEFATRRRVTVVMFTVAILLFGFVSLSRLKVNLLPDLSYPTLTVRTELAGAAPLELENLITRPVEEAVGIIRNVRQVRSVSRSGQSDVILEFAWGTDMDLAGIDVREKLDLLQLPLEAKRPVLLRFDPSSEPVLRLAFMDTQAEGASSTRPEDEQRLKSLRRFADDRLKPELESVEGSAAVKVSGGYEDEIQVFVDQQKLAALGLPIERVTSRLRAENVNLSGGRLEQGSQRFLVRTLNEFTSVEQMADSIIATVDGSPVYLKDVATVTHGHKEREAITRVDGRESIELAVYKEGDANTVLLASGIEKRLAALKDTLPAGTEIRKVYDQSKFISSAINEVKEAAVIGGLLAIFVLYLFLRDARATFITSVAIPVSVIGTFVLMYAFDVTLNIMSLGGIALAVGMLVDNAVVVLEAIVRKREHGYSRADAARLGTQEVSMAVTAATLTSVAVFFPMVFISGIAGQLFKDQALTVTFALSFSLLVALTLVPMLMAGREEVAPPATSTNPVGRVGRAIAAVLAGMRRAGGAISSSFRWALGPLAGATNRGYLAIERVYAPTVRWALHHRARVLGFSLLLFIGTLAIVPLLGKELIPQLSQGEFNVDVRLAPGTPLEETDRSVASAQAISAARDDVSLSYSVTGTGNRLDANPTDAGENTGRLSITLKPGSKKADEARAIEGLRGSFDGLPGVQYQFSRPSLFSFSTPLEVVISGAELDRLKAAASTVQAQMEASGKFRDIKSTVEAGNPEIQIVFDQERASQLGLSVRDLADRVVSSVRGDVATRYTLREKKIDVLVRSVDTRAASVEQIRSLIVNPGSDRPVTLAAVADVTLAIGPAEIRRAGQERVAILSANAAGGDLGAAVGELERIVAATELPIGTAAYVSGQSEDMRESFLSLQFTLVLAVFLVYLVMASQFESLVHPLVILFTIPLAAIGSVWAMFITGTTVNVVAYIGLIMLAGIVVNQSIVLIDAVNQARERGLDREAAIVEAGRTRLRPILITKLTTVLGLMPMALGIGEGAEIRQPMAIAVIGGVLISSLFTLIVIPVVYALLDRKVYRAAAPQPAAAPGAALASEA